MIPDVNSMLESSANANSGVNNQTGNGTQAAQPSANTNNSSNANANANATSFHAAAAAAAAAREIKQQGQRSCTQLATCTAVQPKKGTRPHESTAKSKPNVHRRTAASLAARDAPNDAKGCTQAETGNNQTHARAVDTFVRKSKHGGGKD